MLISICERQRLAIERAAIEGVVLNHRHFLQLDETISIKNKRQTWERSKKKRTPRKPRRFNVEQAAAIRLHYAAGEISYRELAKIYSCGLRCINQIVKRWGAYKLDP